MLQFQGFYATFPINLYLIRHLTPIPNQTSQANDDGRDSLSHMEERISDAVACQPDIINASDTSSKYSGNISYTEVTERTESNDSAHGSDFGLERQATEECVKQQWCQTTVVSKELPMDKVQNQTRVFFDGNGNMVGSEQGLSKL